MGIIADSLRARLDEMRVRHAATDREIAESREALLQALAEMQAITEEMGEECV